MTDKKISTESYKGVRDFYPSDAAVQQHIFDTWRKTAESFGFERYDASILEPAELYKAKGAENEEMVNEQTYTFTDRGDREVTLRPEMTPTVARMVAGKARELAFPLRWYSTPNLFRYERPQKGRLREHWQLNCDIFGSDDITADIEIIALAHQTMLNFGASSDDFVILINDRALMTRLYKSLGIPEDKIPAITRLNDKKNKIDDHEYRHTLKEIVGDGLLVEEIIMLLEKSDEQTDVVIGLEELGITNVRFDKTLARGFDYYTGTIFEIAEVDETGKVVGRSLAGGGRYDNLTAMFGGEPISGVGFGMGDVALRDFLVEKNLLPELGVNTELTLLPETQEFNLSALKIATEFRSLGIKTRVDISDRKINKKVDSLRKKANFAYIIINENNLELNSSDGTKFIGTAAELANYLK